METPRYSADVTRTAVALIELGHFEDTKHLRTKLILGLDNDNPDRSILLDLAGSLLAMIDDLALVHPETVRDITTVASQVRCK